MAWVGQWQADACRNSLNCWNSATCRVVTRVPTQRELEDKTLSYEQIVSKDAAPSTKSLVFSAIRSGNVDLLKVLPAMQGRLFRFAMRGRLFCLILLCVRLDADQGVHLQNALEQFGACVTLRDDINFNTGAYYANRPKRLLSPT
jgi:hypothetical protein